MPKICRPLGDKCTAGRPIRLFVRSLRLTWFRSPPAKSYPCSTARPASCDRVRRRIHGQCSCLLCCDRVRRHIHGQCSCLLCAVELYTSGCLVCQGVFTSLVGHCSELEVVGRLDIGRVVTGLGGPGESNDVRRLERTTLVVCGGLGVFLTCPIHSVRDVEVYQWYL